jgi:hypothetical protein
MRRLLLFFLLVGLAAAQVPAFRTVGDLIPSNAGPVLGLADFDQDGDLDLLTNGTGIYLNDGHGLFTPHPVLSAVIGFPYSLSGASSAALWVPVLAIGDINGDGFPDVIESHNSSFPTITKWINQGNGVLLATGFGIPFTNNGGPRALALGDVDADGDLDLVISRAPVTHYLFPPTFQPLLLWLNNGAGTFTTAPAQISTTPMSPAQIALRDFDGDGIVDLIAGNFGNLYLGPPPSAPLLFLNNPPGVFSQTGISIPAPPALDFFAASDINGDGLTDLVLDTAPVSVVCPASVTALPLILVNTGGGAFSPLPSSIVGPLIGGIPRLVDLDADGHLDLLRLTYRGAEAYPLTPSSAGPISWKGPLVGSPYDDNSNLSTTSNAVGDVDGDSDQDVVEFTAQGNVVLFNDSTGNPVVVNGRLAANRSAGATVITETPRAGADLEGDGDIDLVLGFFDCGNGTELRLATNNGAGNLSETVALPCSACPLPAAIGPRVFFDADQDGDLDAFIAPAGYGIPAFQVLTSGGAALSVSQTLTPSPTSMAAKCLAAGDLDSDGDIDVVAGMAGGTMAYVFLNNGAGSFQLAGSLPGFAAHDLVLLDADGDQDLDVATIPSLFLNDGSGGFTPAVGLPGPPPGYTLDAGDLDGDGDADLLVDNLIFLNTGTGAFTPAGSVPLVNYTVWFVGLDTRALDVDGDGDLDIVEARGWFHRNAGNATFSAAEPLPRGLTFPIALADFDGDGDQDLVAKGPSILTNMSRQLSRGVPARPGRPASLELGAAPGTPWALFASTGTTSFPLPPLGTVRLDLAGLQLAAVGTTGPNGLSTVTAVVPATPGIVGLTIYLQAVVYHASGPRLTGLEVVTVAAF